MSMDKLVMTNLQGNKIRVGDTESAKKLMGKHGLVIKPNVKMPKELHDILSKAPVVADDIDLNAIAETSTRTHGNAKSGKKV